jgi:hypothetical protein
MVTEKKAKSTKLKIAGNQKGIEVARRFCVFAFCAIYFFFAPKIKIRTTALLRRSGWVGRWGVCEEERGGRAG